MVQYQNNVWAQLEKESVQSTLPVCQMKMGNISLNNIFFKKHDFPLCHVCQQTSVYGSVSILVALSLTF